MTNVVFQHERVRGGEPLVVTTGVDEIAWSYHLNVAKYQTYGGEVVQILSAYVEDLNVTGTVRNYEHAEDIYSFFMEYFTKATQGTQGKGVAEADHFTQVPMTMTYEERAWLFSIQPLSTPGFVYSLETVAPKWTLVAHIVDTGNDVQALKDMIIAESALTAMGSEFKRGFKLKGVISPDSGDPALNPFISPVADKKGPKGEAPKTGESATATFEPIKAKEVGEGLGHLADYYSSLLPSYMKGNFEDIAALSGAKPAFGGAAQPAGAAGGGENVQELLQGTPAAGPPK